MSIDVASYFPGGPDRRRDGNAFPAIDTSDVEECRALLGNGRTERMVEEIEGYGCSTAEELAALRDRELWGDDPFGEF